MVSTSEDPFYSRKPVPDAFIADVGDTGLTKQEEFANRERKYSLADGSDIRSHTPKIIATPTDPYYTRKRVSDAEIHGVGETGLTPQEEFLTRERKYSLKDGSDARKFSNAKSLLRPTADPYFGRRPVADPEIHGVGELGDDITPAEAYERRERKQSLFQTSDDPFDNLKGHHRQSVSGGAALDAAKAATARRRSSAIAPDAMHAAAAHHHSGYAGGDNLAPIESKPELPPVSRVSEAGGSSTAADSSSAAAVNGHSGEHTSYYDAATGAPPQTHSAHGFRDDDDIAPNDTSRNPVTTTT